MCPALHAVFKADRPGDAGARGLGIQVRKDKPGHARQAVRTPGQVGRVVLRHAHTHARSHYNSIWPGHALHPCCPCTFTAHEEPPTESAPFRQCRPPAPRTLSRTHARAHKLARTHAPSLYHVSLSSSSCALCSATSMLPHCTARLKRVRSSFTKCRATSGNPFCCR